MLRFFLDSDPVEMTEEEGKAALNYKYNGGDTSYSYVYFHSPVAETVAKIMPRRIAPNVITFVAAMCLLLPHLHAWFYYTSGFEASVNPWHPLIVGVLYFLYITLDNVDGKHARNTGQQGPMGQIFDHGFDTLTLPLSTLTLCLYTQSGNNIQSHLSIFIALTGFFTFNLKEYYVGEYIL